MLPATPGQLEQHSLSSDDWMYWSLNLTQDATSLLVQLNRSAGDPVLFLKPAEAGFQVRTALLNSTKTHRVPFWSRDPALCGDVTLAIRAIDGPASCKTAGWHHAGMQTSFHDAVHVAHTSQMHMMHMTMS